MRLSFYLRYSGRALRRDGQRTLLALLCIAFGVASLTALSLLSAATRDSIIVDPRLELGGDLLLQRGADSPREASAVLEQLQAADIIDQWMPIGARSQLFLKSGDSTYFLNRLLAVAPRQYPLVGTIRLAGEQTLAEALATPGSALITRDLVRKRQLALGDEITVVAQIGSAPLRLRITGIVDDMPDRRGDTILISRETPGAAAIFSGAMVLATVGPAGEGLQQADCATAVTPADSADRSAAEALCQRWQIAALPERTPSGAQVAALFDLMLKGAGLLGLLVGGIGVANTMQLLLARRQRELAVLSTVGYARHDLLLLVAVESLLLGAAGSVAGLAGAIPLFYPLATLLGGTEGTLMIQRQLTVGPLFSGAAAGIVTALIFGLSAAVRASAVRPASLLREAVEAIPRRSTLWTLALWLLLSLLFALLSALVLNSLLAGLAVVAVAAAGLLLLGTLFALLLRLLVWLPLPTGTLGALAQQNLKRQGLRPIFALIALWAGIFAIGFAGTAMQNAQQRVDQQRPESGSELVLVAPLASEARVRTQLAAEGIKRPLRPRSLVNVVMGEQLLTSLIVEGRRHDDLIEFTWEGAPGTLDGLYLDVRWRNSPLLPAGHAIEVGQPLTLVLAEGQKRTLPVAGFFTPPASEQLPALFWPDIIADAHLVREWAADEGALVVVSPLPADRLAATQQRLDAVLPETFVYSSAQQSAALVRQIRGLLAFVVSVAALALLAGAVLIANAVSLALLERRREMGILKAVGFSHAHLLRLLLIENGLLGLIGGGAALATLRLAVGLINRADPLARLRVDPLAAVALWGLALLVALVSTVGVAWQPARLRPLVVLRDA